MTSGSGRKAARALLLLGLIAPAARDSVAAQSLPRREFGVEALLAASDPVFAGGGLYAAVRPSPRVRVALTATAGGIGGDVAFRGELLGHFLLTPLARGAAVYLGGGAALLAAGDTRGYVVALVGIESRPAARSGWFVEGGAGGGARVAAGWRRRWGFGK
jgi:hypothetical protein